MRLTMASVLGSLTGIAVLGLGASAVSAAPSKKVKCVVYSTNQTPGKTSGDAFGFVKCPPPFGNGVQFAVYQETVTGTHVTNKGSFTNYYNLGTDYGTFKISGTAHPSGRITLTGPIKVTGGTGAFKGKTLSGTLTCKTKDGGKTEVCTAVGK